MSEGKSTNLLKAAKELNIGLNTAVEFLGKKGHKVEARPNTKLTDEMYDVLLKEFQGDKIVKEEAKQIVIGKIRRDDIPVTNEKTEPQRSKDFEQEEILIKNVNPYTPPAVEKPKAEPQEPVVTEPKPEEGALPGVKVVGKINLDDLNSKTRPDKKNPEPEKPVAIPAPAAKVEEPVKVKEPEVIPQPAPEKAEPKVETAPVAEIKEPAESPKETIKEQPEAPVAKPVVEEKQENKPNTQESNPNATVIRAKAERLSGPNVIGRIELPVSPARRGQPVASSSSAAGADHKRKRKRKDNAPGQPGQPTQQGQQGQQAGGSPRPAPGA